MSLNQYAIYQLKMEASVRPLRYKTYQYLLDNHLRADAENYHQVYLTTMVGEQTPEGIRRQLEKKLPPKFMNPPEQPQKPPVAYKPSMEVWQKYYENGEYLRTAESYGEQNYDMIDGRANNRSKEEQRKATTQTAERSEERKMPVKEPAIKAAPGKRKSVLQRLRDKQAEVAARYGKKAPEQAKDDMERDRK